MSLFDKLPTPEAAALISMRRTTGSTTLFASPFDHQGFITLQIKACEVQRSSGHTLYFGRKNYIEIAMSYNQFAEAITTMNMGDGVPCTMRYLEERKFADPEPENQKPIFEQEGLELLKRSIEKIDKSIADLDLLKMSKKDQMTARAALVSVRQDLESNLPFYAKSYSEYIDDVTQQGKTEIAAYMETAALQHGFTTMAEANQTQKVLSFPQETADAS
jgi:hypothetical protein